MAGEFESKIVVISGGSRGIGRGIALAFARVGAQTVIASSSQSNLAAAAKAIAAEGTAPLAVAGDLRTLEGCQRLFARVNETYRHCDVLINNAGATRAGGFLDLPDEVWLDGFALKFFGCVRLTRLFWPLLKAARGSLVNIVVGAGRTPDAEFHIGGSVNASGVRNVDRLFCVNERLTTFLQTPRGACAVVAVGAMNVGRIRAVYDDVVTNVRRTRAMQRKEYDKPIPVEKGGELAIFEMGSTVLAVFAPGVKLSPDVAVGLAIKLGERLE